MTAGRQVYDGLLDWLVFAPLWSVALVLLIGMAGCALLGSYLRGRLSEASAYGLNSDQEAFVSSAVSGLLALLIGFTFSVSMDRFDDRRDQVLEQANAIQGAYFNAQILPEPHRTRLSRLLIAYTDLHVQIGSMRPGPQRDRLYPIEQELTTDLAAASVAAFPAIQSMDFSSTFEDSVRRIFEANATWKNARRAHVPAQVYALLFVYEIMASLVLGFVLNGRGSRWIAALLLALSAAALTLVIDIDRPATGRINESQTALKDLQTFMRHRPPAAFDRYQPGPQR